MTDSKKRKAGPKSLGIILGSAFENEFASKLMLEPEVADTPWGRITLFSSGLSNDRPVYILFRHGLPHSLLPNQINYRAQAAALQQVNCGALLINSSVGVLDPDLPIYKPMLVTDLLMPENRLPDGSTCTMYPEPKAHQGHLLIREGLFSQSLNEQISARHPGSIFKPENGLVFVYAGGPRSKTAAENRMWAQLGGQVNSMTLAPEVVLANELEIPVSALVVGHKYSVPGRINPEVRKIAETLVDAREATESILLDFIEHGEPVVFANQIYRY
ncbi:5'-methylthioadenosine phosphorylase [Rhodohalobacter mucosus]|uniref:5'-methylthioadenosine phosphorylase n=1 Tax=Rhodohalobacter mucosus TaxID=2079485 RepID=A0A316TNH2_9BACT|nr:5'-methylthioadenosine phosphorylase [Rhodohalobacter mucosus]PWN05328.1 5'-methylthioadenosine phosphorylase [Rhodohalobacter mucosus]